MTELNRKTMAGGGVSTTTPAEDTPTGMPGAGSATSRPPTTEELLAQTLAELREMREQQKKDRDQISLLTEVADKGRMEHVTGRRPKDNITVVKVSYYKDLPVVAWRTVMDEVFKDGENVWHEKQIVELTTEDGEKHKMDLTDRFRNVKKVPATVVTRRRTNDGFEGEPLTEVFRVRLQDGRELDLDGTFIN